MTDSERVENAERGQASAEQGQAVAEQGQAHERAKTWWAIFTSIVCTAATVIAGVIYVNTVASDSERKWCGIVVTLDDSYSLPRAPGASPPSTVGQRIMDEMKRLRREFDC
jgi:hypothetical protein